LIDALDSRIARICGARRARRGARIATVWGGYGQVWRYELEGAERGTVVVKHIAPGKGSGRSHDRKLRSYQVEACWYQQWAERCGEDSPVPACLGIEQDRNERLFVLEDLDAAGFPRRRERPRGAELDAMIRWLAAFHARFLGERPRGLWKTGSYWHLRTRPDEHRSMGRGPLRDAAAVIDARLNGARFQSLIHGDAKPANFQLSRDARHAAALDFQYVGGGCGVKDLAYLLAGEAQGVAEQGAALYFRSLRAALPEDGAAVAAEWRELLPWAWADLQRFLEGWAPGWRFQRHELAMTRRVLEQL
jgi:aminoglycoside phosphotransferase (APT) family kinase protein